MTDPSNRNDRRLPATTPGSLIPGFWRNLTTARVVEYLEQSGWARHGVLWQSPRHTRDLYEMREALALQAAADVAELVSGVASPRIHRLPKEADHA